MSFNKTYILGKAHFVNVYFCMYFQYLYFLRMEKRRKIGLKVQIEKYMQINTLYFRVFNLIYFLVCTMNLVVYVFKLRHIR